MKSDNKLIIKFFVIWLLSVITVITVILLIIKQDVDKQQNEPQEITFSGDSGYVSPQDNNIKLKAMTGLVFKHDSHMQDVDIENDAENKYLIDVTLAIDDGTILYKSDLLKPGGVIKSIFVEDYLQIGIYKDTHLVYNVYNLDGTYISQCDFKIEIKVI